MFFLKMKVIIQRCSSAHVVVDQKVVGSIGLGLTVFLGIMQGDSESQIHKIIRKMSQLRIFSDNHGKFNHSLRDINGSILLIPNFTICGDVSKGNRPSFGAAASPAIARELFERFATLLSESKIAVQTGCFATDMKVFVENDGPVTLVLEVK